MLRPAVRSSVVGEELHSGSRGPRAQKDASSRAQKDASSRSPQEQNVTVKETNHVAVGPKERMRKEIEKTEVKEDSCSTE